MNVIIAGLSNIGMSLADLLSKAGNEVVVVDLDAGKCAEMAECSDVMAIAGNATKKSVLEEAGIRNANALVAVSGDDSHNLMISMLAKEMGVRQVITVVSDEAHAEMFKQAGVGFQVKPDTVVATHIQRMISQPYVKDFLSFESSEIFEIQIEEGMKCVGRKVSEMGTPNGIRVLVVQREGGYLNGDATMESRDWLTLIVNRASTKKVTEFMDRWFTKG
jgi:trk system potassium uptake protein TrkA